MIDPSPTTYERHDSFHTCSHARLAAAKTGVGADTTTLIGFSQGAIMALESTQQPVAIAGRVISLSGRFASAPHVAPPCPVHLIHGDADPIIASPMLNKHMIS